MYWVALLSLNVTHISFYILFYIAGLGSLKLHFSDSPEARVLEARKLLPVRCNGPRFGQWKSGGNYLPPIVGVAS